MSYAGFRFTGRFAVNERPEDRPPAVEGETWAKDKVGGVGGTEIDATWVNRLRANLERLVTRLDGDLNVGDDQLADAVGNAVDAKADAEHDHDDLYYPKLAVDALLAGLQEIAQKGLANGYAGLDGSGKVPTAQLPDAVLGALAFQAVWNASTNTPALTSGAGTKGHYYIVGTDGATALNGISDWKVGDWAVYDGTVWRKIDNTDAIAAVAGLTGNISAASLKTALAIAVADITDASANGRSLMSAANYAAMRVLLGVIATADIVNDLTTNDNTKPLSAAMGKSLKDQIDALVASTALPRGHLWGMTLSNNVTDATNDIDIAAGSCRSDDDTENIVIAAPITKRLDAAWAVGGGNGGRDTGSIADATWHIWAIKRTDTGVVDVLFSQSASAPTLPANYTKKRRIGSVIRASAALLAFFQFGDRFELKSVIVDVNVATLGTTPANYALTVPSGINVEAIIDTYVVKSSTGFWAYVYSPLHNDEVPTSGISVQPNASGVSSIGAQIFRVMTDTSRQVRAVSTAAATTFVIGTMGWIDTRGRLA